LLKREKGLCAAQNILTNSSWVVFNFAHPEFHLPSIVGRLDGMSLKT
jgi:hypothetical protein